MSRAPEAIFQRWPSVVSQKTLHYSDAVQSFFASDIEHFGSQTDAERRVKNHRLSEGQRPEFL
jgi:hypothetical protein